MENPTGIRVIESFKGEDVQTIVDVTKTKASQKEKSS